MTSIYFDHAATTPMRAEAISAYADAAGAGPGNPSSLHAFGRSARGRVTAARDTLAQLLGCSPSELVFTGSGTESDNTALFGAARAQRAKGRTGIVTSSVEHHAVLHACDKLKEEGFRITLLPVDETGRVAVSEAEQAIDDTTAVVSIMAGNNETGTLQPYAEIAQIAKNRGAVMHVDAVQAFGYEPIDLQSVPVDLLSVSAHKINGPQGVGLLFVRRGTPFQPLLYGGNQERARRAGTENVAGIAAFAEAARLSAGDLDARRSHAEQIRQAFLQALETELGRDAFVLNGNAVHRLPHIANISFLGLNSETMLMNLDLAGVAASAGSACTSGSLQPSHVLTAMNLPRERVQSAIRFSFGLGNTTAEAEKTAKIVATISARLRNR
ncbi:cysteine desulfurase [Cohnella pontilimi]|uniref:cysteine desulfurase n=1 Tax=Cohnella pontilimi TaxID=2564100 RepID=A0A4V5LSL1_9BACL|nr:cysteine desulfurase family protein [Cohnella pontilimi]TJY43519.1 cysteine desulfurase [Cohnella pontilimi]